ncbi:hypothetical protein Y032_0002g821 [Ancylostoma ceylanicum]|uniref:Uncharacterized protein n=2 Tax=Ancylostoma ceylanicum TaxID=53326 RepID=A0A016W0W4_9BILA|nr:hypothetical protein Y032_0002g821 [Ancylostoma ceylanicum]
MQRESGNPPTKRSRVAQSSTSASAQVGLPHPSASSHRKRRMERSYSRSPSSSRSTTPVSQQPSTSRAIPSQPASTKARLLDRVLSEVSSAQLPTTSKHAKTLPPVDPSFLHAPHQFDPYTRPATVFELISAIAKGQDVNRTFQCDADNISQASSVPRSYRPALHLTHLLTFSLNPDYVFNPTHLGQHDYVLVDSFLHSDLFQQIRSIFTKEIHVPSPSDFTGAQSKHLPVLVVTQALTALTSLSEKVTTYLRELTTQGRPTPDQMLAHLWTLHRYAENILQRRSMIHSHLLPVVFAQPSDIQIMVNLLASYGVTYNKIATAVATSTAIHAEVVKVYDLYHKLLTEHFKSQVGLSALSVQVGDFPSSSASAPAHTHSSITPTSSSMHTTPILAPSQPPEAVESHVPQPMVLSTTPPPQDAPLSPTSSIEIIAEFPAQKSSGVSHVRKLPVKPQLAAGPEDGPPKPIPLERQQAVTSSQSQQQPQQPSLPLPTCHFCDGRHWSSSCSVVSRLSDRMRMNANRGGCFLCCRKHAEKDCLPRERKYCRACRSKSHDTSYCPRNKDVENDIDATQYNAFLEQCKAMADMVRKGESKGFQ